jgi:hypothetical protein
MLADIDQIRAFVYGGSSQPDAIERAVDLVSWSQRMSELFPIGQASNDYVDMSLHRVRGAAEAMTRNAELLLSAVRTGRRPEIGDQLVRTEKDGCGSCHLSGTR